MFPQAIIEALKLLSNSYMANILQYATTQFDPYFVAAVECLRHVSSDLVEIYVVKAERDKLKERVLVLEAENGKFEGCYDLLAKDKAFV